jgi:hypothetical protein
MQTLLFDDKGEQWDATSRLLADELHSSLPSRELSSYAVRNLGFIAASEQNGSLRLSLRPAIVSPMALSGLLYWIFDRTIERALISFLDKEWSHELLRTKDEVVHRLLARTRREEEDRRGDFLQRQKPLHDLPRTSPLRAVLDAWSACNGHYDPERLYPMLQKAINGRFFLVEAFSTKPSLVVREVGEGYTGNALYWLSRSKGLRVEDQPDHAYGKWVTTHYREVVNARAPSLQDVDAVITWPQQPRIGYRYRRLVVPFETGSDSTLLLSATIIDPNINLRVKGA